MKTPSLLTLATACGLTALFSTSTLPAKTIVTLKQVADGFTSAVALVPWDDQGRLLVVDQVGVISLVDREGGRGEQPFLDLRPRMVKLKPAFDERGLLGLALHPKFKTNRRIFVYYSAPLREGGPEEWDHTSRIVEFKVPMNGVAADSNSERLLLEIDQPYFNHNGGALAFGPDGHLYIAIGDGGNANDVGRGHSPQGNGQDTSTLLGKILRIDVDSTDKGYAIPKDNPFAANKEKGRPEIFAYGLRNPWRISFDRGGKHELFAADVGQTLYEEINLIVKGGNYGWNIREGNHCFDPKAPKTSPSDCPKVGASGEPLIGPLFEYKNNNGWQRDPEGKGISVTGGYIYRGKAIPALQGQYVFGDWSGNWALPDGVLYSAKRGENGSWSMDDVQVSNNPKGRVGAYVTAFGEDAEGEIYVLTNGRNTLTGTTGKILKIVPAE